MESYLSRYFIIVYGTVEIISSDNKKYFKFIILERGNVDIFLFFYVPEILEEPEFVELKFSDGRKEILSENFK